MMSDLIQENERLAEENKELKERIVAMNEKEIGFNGDFNYENVLKLKDFVFRILSDMDSDNYDNRTEEFVEELANMDEACDTFIKRIYDWR